MSRGRHGCLALAEEMAGAWELDSDTTLLRTLIRLIGGVCAGVPRNAPDLEDRFGSKGGFTMTRSSIEQAAVDLLARNIAGLTAETTPPPRNQ